MFSNCYHKYLYILYYVKFEPWQKIYAKKKQSKKERLLRF